MGLSVFAVQAAITAFSGEEIETIITTHALDFDFIMIDIRDDMEVESGIIASEYCKPYHLSWNSGDFDDHYNEIPKDVAVIVYCRSGSRARSAVTLLSNEGFETVGTLEGGINSYPGTLEDSSAFKPVSDLPAPSYLGDPASTVKKPVVQRRMNVFMSEPLHYTVTLSGKIVSGNNGNFSPALFIDCYRSSGEKTTGRMMLFKRK